MLQSKISIRNSIVGFHKLLVDQIVLHWTTLAPYIAEITSVAEWKAKTLDCKLDEPERIALAVRDKTGTLH